MESLTPIPGDSRMARDILQMEDVLRRMRDSLPENVRPLIGVHDASRGGNVTAFSNIVLSDEPTEYLHYYRYYAIEWRNRFATDVERASLRTAGGPDYVKVHSEDRLAWVDSLPQMLRALNGLPVSVQAMQTWRWDSQRLRPNGQSTYVPAYEVMVLRGAKQEFRAESVLPGMLARICRANHPLADCHLFDWQQDTLGELLFHSFHWTEFGLAAAFETKSALERAKAELFAGLSHQVDELPANRWMLTLDLRAGPLSPA